MLILKIKFVYIFELYCSSILKEKNIEKKMQLNSFLTIKFTTWH
jgi:hypothetical protein